MKPLSRKVKSGFDTDSFVAAMASKNINIGVNTMPPNKSFLCGEIDHINGRAVRFTDNEHYIAGYNSYEPLIITRRREGKKPQYTLADVDYQTPRDMVYGASGLPEWFNSVSEAIYYARAIAKPEKLGRRFLEYHEKNKNFEMRVFEDSQIKPDVDRIYQSTMTGELSTSIDNGKTWFLGGIMDYPLMPNVDVRESRGYRAVGKGWDYDHVIRTSPRADELKKCSFKLKPPRPEPPKFDAIAWRNDEFSWWTWHLEQSIECANKYLFSETTEVKNPRYEQGDDEMFIYQKNWRCDCYHAKVKEYENAVKQYEKAIEKWFEL